MQRADSLEKTLILEKIEGKRRRGKQKMRWLDSIINSMGMNLSKVEDSVGRGSLVCCGSWGHRESDTTERLNNSSLFIVKEVLVEKFELH